MDHWRHRQSKIIKYSYRNSAQIFWNLHWIFSYFRSIFSPLSLNQNSRRRTQLLFAPRNQINRFHGRNTRTIERQFVGAGTSNNTNPSILKPVLFTVGVSTCHHMRQDFFLYHFDKPAIWKCFLIHMFADLGQRIRWCHNMGIWKSASANHPGITKAFLQSARFVCTQARWCGEYSLSSLIDPFLCLNH